MKLIIVLLLSLAAFMFWGISQQVEDCKQKGATPIQTNEGTTCFSGIIK